MKKRRFIALASDHDRINRYQKRNYDFANPFEFQGKLGNILMHQMGKKTESLDPSHTYVPWIVVNGQHTEEIQVSDKGPSINDVCS